MGPYTNKNKVMEKNLLKLRFMLYLHHLLDAHVAPMIFNEDTTIHTRTHIKAIHSFWQPTLYLFYPFVLL